MIAQLTGNVIAVGPGDFVIGIGGFGLRVVAAPRLLAALRPGGEVTLATSLVVREDSLTLFGFADPAERDLFELLRTASGVGPRLALAVLATLAPAEVVRALSSGDTAVLTRVPGIGRKGAERLVLELGDRVGALDHGHGQDGFGSASPTESAGAWQRWWQQPVSDALESLGWSGREVSRVLDRLAAEHDTGMVPEPSVPADDAHAALAQLVRRAIRIAGGSPSPDRGDEPARGAAARATLPEVDVTERPLPDPTSRASLIGGMGGG